MTNLKCKVTVFYYSYMFLIKIYDVAILNTILNIYYVYSVILNKQTATKNY